LVETRLERLRWREDQKQSASRGDDIVNRHYAGTSRLQKEGSKIEQLVNTEGRLGVLSRDKRRRASWRSREEGSINT